MKAAPRRRGARLQLAVHPLGQLPRDRQAEAGAARGVAGEEALEGLARACLGDARTARRPP